MKTPGISPGVISMRAPALRSLRRCSGRALRGRLAVDERRDLGGHLGLQGRGLISRELVIRDRFVDPRVPRRRERGDEAVATLAFVVRDIAKALAPPHRVCDAVEPHSTPVFPTGLELVP